MRLNPRGFEVLGATRGDAARSFWAAFVLLPLFVLYTGLEALERGPGLNLGLFGAVKIEHYVLGWVLYPVIMDFVSRLLDRRDAYYRWLTAYNWVQVPIMAAFLPLVLLAALGLAPADALTLLNGIVFLAMSIVLGFVARHGLFLPLSSTIGVVVLDLVVGEAVHGILAPLIDAMPSAVPGGA
ncbi:hypothetical protein ROR02_30580 [Pararhodospirillum oryzae]|uniref:Uncharacterized protein n=2 Tax=Pararhodospirillum oryzae TaxID=478448 RepID=A0A512HBU5_9PROT|nr:hypothetical protein ROR02_30580 [Pararhodospirillum oryzae]